MPSKSFAAAIHDALGVALASDPAVIVYGLGATDPKGVFGTTLDLHKKFGGERVFDMPTSENAMTGIGVGAALGGLRPVLTHQRLDFALLSRFGRLAKRAPVRGRGEQHGPIVVVKSCRGHFLALGRMLKAFKC